MLVMAVFTVGMLVPFTMAGMAFVKEMKDNMPKGYEYPELADMKITAIAAIFFAVIEIVMRKVFYKMFIPFCREQDDKLLQERRSGKAAFCIYKSIYFIWATSWGYIVLKDQPYLPPWFGGSGSIDVSFEGWPYPSHCPSLKNYFLITMGYHVGGLITHFFSSNKQNDFIEMGLHHIVAIYLFGGAYVYNILNLGAVVALLHDIADITTNIVKTLTESNDKTFIAPVFITHMGIWFYTRLLVLPYIIYRLAVWDIYLGSVIVKPFFCWLLCCMFMLHCYWFKMFCGMLMKYTKSGATEDT